MFKGYNLSDIIRFNFKDALRFENTIAHQYLSQIDEKKLNSRRPMRPAKINFNLLYQIVNKQIFEPVPDNAIAIHIRVGDILGHVPPAETYTNIIQKYELNKRFDECILFYGFHKRANVKESEEYLLNLKNKIEKLNLKCNLRSGSADEDFSALATSKCYVAGYRGFSWLSASINPNEVIWDIQNPPDFPWAGRAAPRFRAQLRTGWEFNNKS